MRACSFTVLNKLLALGVELLQLHVRQAVARALCARSSGVLLGSLSTPSQARAAAAISASALGS
jgi:hypothetical protein